MDTIATHTFEVRTTGFCIVCNNERQICMFCMLCRKDCARTHSCNAAMEAISMAFTGRTLSERGM